MSAALAGGSLTREALAYILLFFILNPSVKLKGDFPAGPVVNISPSNAEGADLIPGRGAKIPYALWPRNQDISNISSIVKNSIKTKKKKLKEVLLSLLLRKLRFR